MLEPLVVKKTDAPTASGLRRTDFRVKISNDS
jgi:hypothetical protein